MLATAFAIPTELTSSFQLVSKRPAGACNFVEEEAEFGKGTKVIYRQVRERERERGLPRRRNASQSPTVTDVSPPNQTSPRPTLQFATLFFVVVADQAESDLGILDLIQVYVEALDQIFENVCELNIVFSQPKAQTLLDELLTGGLVLDTSSAEIVNRFREVDKAMRAQDPPPGPGGSALGPGRPGMRPGPGPGRGPQVIRPPGPGMR